MRWTVFWSFVVFVSCASAAGLSVGEDGTLLRDGVPFRGIGVNYYDAFTRTLERNSRTNYSAGFEELARRKISFARFSAGGYWPADWSLYQTNRTEYFTRLDGVVRSAEKYGVGLIPSLFWHSSTIPDLVGEPVSKWGDTNSRTHSFMREYTREVVARYKDSPAILGWEFGNEYNLGADLPNAAQHRPPIVPRLGTPESRSAADDLSHDLVRTAFAAFAIEVRRLDAARIILTGNSFPRPSAWHQAKEKSWKRDTAEQFSQMLAADNPSPVNTLCVRGYELKEQIGRLPAAMELSRRLRKPLVIGEFGVPGFSAETNRPLFTAMLDAIETNRVPLAALWVFDFDGQARDWNVTATNGRSWQLHEIEKRNERMRAEAGRKSR